MEVTDPLKTEGSEEEGPHTPDEVVVETPTMEPVMLQYPSEYNPYGAKMPFHHVTAGLLYKGNYLSSSLSDGSDSDQLASISAEELRGPVKLKIPGDPAVPACCAVGAKVRRLQKQHGLVVTLTEGAHRIAICAVRNVLEIREAFRVLDRDGNGFISKQELGMAMRSLGYMPSEVELAIIMQRLDMDGDGQVDFDEFMTILGPKLLSSETREGFLGNTIDSIFWQVRI
ncbi:hypothetical protein JZ751_022844 [Albula glossodonta]|uniref:EF-hand domain-containing protein n=1 Tax=Albula glossodonta TaxID=121402 RepID=A0A8T2PE32_9TELE|nr:hypothetical protein JZ751_022844 [Albula glossodonta]